VARANTTAESTRGRDVSADALRRFDVICWGVVRIVPGRIEATTQITGQLEKITAKINTEENKP